MVFKTIQQYDENGVATNQRVVTWLKARKIAQDELSASLARETVTLEVDRDALFKYEQACRQGTVSTAQFETIMSGASVQAKEYAIATQGVAGSTDVFVSKQKQAHAQLRATATASKSASVAMKTLSVAGNMLTMWAITEVIQLSAKALNNWINSVDIAKEKAEESKATIDELKSTYESHKKTIEECASSYEKLAKGVDTANNKNLTLSNEDYEEYCDTVNKIAEVFPELAKSVDENGVAILNFSDNTKTASENLQEFLEKEQKVANLKIAQSLPDLFGGVKAYEIELNNAESKYKDLNEEIESFNKLSSNIINGNNAFSGTGDYSNVYNVLIESLSKYREYLIDTGKIMDSSLNPENIINIQQGLNGEYTLLFDTTGISDLEKLSEYVAEISSEVSGTIRDSVGDAQTMFSEATDSYNTAWKDFTGSLVDAMHSKSTYASLDPITQQLADTLVSNLSSDVASEMDDKDPYKWIQSNIISQLNKIGESNEKQIILDKFQKLLSFEDGDLNVLAIATELEKIFSNLGITIDLTPIVGNEKSATEKLANSLDSITKNNISDKKNLNDYTKDFTESEIELWLRATNGAKNAEDAIKSYEIELAKLLEKSTSESYDPLSITETVEKLKTLEDSMSSLQESYLMLQEGEEIDLSSLDGIRESFAELEGIDMDVVNEALNGIANAKTIDEAQSSMNALATEYLHSSKMIENLNEENAELVANKLKLIGFTEAEEIVARNLAAQQEFLKAKKEGVADANDNCRITSENLNNATQEEIYLLLKSAQTSDQAKQALANLALQKINLNNTPLDTSADVKALEELAAAAGMTTEYISGIKEGVVRVQYAPETAKQAFLDKFKKDLTDYEFNYDYKAPDISGGGGSGSTKEEEKDTIEIFDFLEIKIDRLTTLYDKLKDKASKTFQNLTKRTDLYSEALERNAELLELNETAYKYYENYANSIGLSEEYVQQVRDGSINIEEFKNDEELTKKINDYQQWYEKAVECQEALETLREEQRQIVQDSIEMVITKYDQLLDKYESKKEKVSKKLDLSESFGFFAKPASYNKMNTYIQKQVGLYEKQIGKLKELKKTVDYGSEAWREYQARINDANASIKDLTVSIAENAYSASEISKQRADKKVETLDSKDEMTDTKIGNALGYIRKNNLINTKSNRIDKRQTQYDKAVTRSTNSLKKTKNKINKVKNKSGDKKYSTVLKNVKSRIKSGKRIGEQLLNKVANLDDNLALFNLCSQYNAYFDARKENKEIANLFEQTAKQQKADLALEKLSNIELKYGYGISANDRNKNNLNNQMALAEEQGKRISTAYYDGMIVSEKSNIAILEKQRKAMQISLNKSVKNGDIEMNSDEWFEAVESINSVTEAIEQGTITIQEYVNAQRQIRWDAFDDALETIQRINSESDYFIERLSKQKLFNEKGEFTNEGNTTVALHGVNYKNNLARAQEYLDEYNRILASGDTSQQAIDRMRELQDAYWSCQQAAEGNLDSVKSLISEGYDKQLDYIGKMIEQYKKLRDSEREAYEYSKEISKKTKNISDLRKQMTALGANDTESSKAKLQQIKLQLEESEEDLKETQYNRFINDSNRMLDDMMNDYELYIDEKLENIYGELPKIVDGIMGQGGIVETLKTIDANLSTTLQGVLNGTIDTRTNASKEVDTLQKQVTAPVTTPAPYSVEQNTNESLLKALEKSEKKNANLKKEELYNKAMDFIDKKASKTTKKRSELKAINKRIHKLTDGMILGTNELKELANILGVKHNGHGENSNLYKKLKEIGIKGFATGSKYIPKDQLAWTQEKGQEVIYSKLTGHMLTPLGKGDKVFTAEMTDKLWEFSRNGIVADSPMREFASKIPDSVNNIQHNTVGDVNIGDIKMYGVNDPQTFAKNLRSAISEDKNVQNGIRAVSVDLLAGKSSYGARKFK